MTMGRRFQRLDTSRHARDTRPTIDAGDLTDYRAGTRPCSTPAGMAAYYTRRVHAASDARPVRSNAAPAFVGARACPGVPGVSTKLRSWQPATEGKMAVVLGRNDPPLRIGFQRHHHAAAAGDRGLVERSR